MNVGRLAVTAVVAFVVDMVYGFLVYGNLLSGQFAAFPGVYRPNTDTAYLPYLALGILIGMFPATYIYAKGYEGRSGFEEGLRFGAVMAVFMAAYVVGVTYATVNIGRGLALSMAIAAVVEWLVVGVVIGLVYKPAAVPARRVSAV